MYKQIREDLAATAEAAIDGRDMRLERGAVGLAARAIDERSAALRDRLAAAVKDRASPRR
ncbi:MAG: hypothetical protein JNL82_30375 [Myxococcales bacterium]|nr:hypothetical protein [Myxococcales bacterium]